MSDDDIHDMMDRAHYAEIREARLRIELDRLKAESARLNGVVESLLTERRRTDGQRLKLMAENERLRKALQELVAFVRGECPRLLDEDRDGDARLSIEIDAALSPQEQVK
jgi:50S ribosomal subunit-associated GTPase HflX